MNPTGIIPARAGFTAPTTSTTAAPPDHPRSRGVYLRPPIAPGIVDGSSPLARGLPGEQGVCPTASGIIPARAGFTHEVTIYVW